MPTVTVIELKAWVGETGSEHDAALTALISRAEAYLQAETGRRIGAAEEVTEVRSGGGDSIFLQDAPVSGEVDSVETRTVMSSDWVAETLTDFEVDGRRLSRLDGALFPEGLNTRINYSRGFSDAPETIKQAVLELCEHWWRNRTRVTDVGVPEGVESSTPDKLPRTVWQFIQRYRGVPVGF